MKKIKIKSKYLYLSAIFAFFLGVIGVILSFRPVKQLPIPVITLSPTPTPTPKILKTIEHYEWPIIAPSNAYTLLFVGDSMTESLGENFDSLRPILEKNYPNKAFGIFNYGFGSTNLLSAIDRFRNDSVYQGKTLPAIFSREFDIVFIESFGNNPLSEYTLEQGLNLQTKTLDQLVAEIVDQKPNSLIVFIATIAPIQDFYGKGAVDLSLDVRRQWANERRAYIENHINYAKRHNLPLVNVYERSLQPTGETNGVYLNRDNYIHPSNEGLHLISQAIVDFLLQYNILPR